MTSRSLNTYCDVTQCMNGLWIFITKHESPKGDSQTWSSPPGNNEACVIIFRVTGPLCGEFTGHWWIPLTKNKRLSKQSRRRWFDTLSHQLWRQSNETPWKQPVRHIAAKPHSATQLQHMSEWSLQNVKYVCFHCAFKLFHNVYSGGVYPWSLHWRQNGLDGVSTHQPHDYLLNRLFKHRSKKTSKLRVTRLSGGIHQWPAISPHKGPVTRKMFPFDDVIMILGQYDRPWFRAAMLKKLGKYINLPWTII